MLKLRTVGFCLSFVSLVNLAACLPPDEQTNATPTASPVPTVVQPVVPAAQVTTYFRACDATTPAGQCDLDNPKIKALVDACKASGQVAELCESREKVAEFKLQVGATTAVGNPSITGCSPMYVSTTDTLRVRSEPKVESTEMGNFENGAEIIPTGKQGDWISHSYNGTTGWSIQKLSGKDTLTCTKPGGSGGGGDNTEGAKGEFSCRTEAKDKLCRIRVGAFPEKCMTKNNILHGTLNGGDKAIAKWTECRIGGKGDEYSLISYGNDECYVLSRNLTQDGWHATPTGWNCF